MTDYCDEVIETPDTNVEERRCGHREPCPIHHYSPTDGVCDESSTPEPSPTFNQCEVHGKCVDEDWNDDTGKSHKECLGLVPEHTKRELRLLRRLERMRQALRSCIDQRDEAEARAERAEATGIFRPPVGDGPIRPCPASTVAYLGFRQEGQAIPCGGAEGHPGSHGYQITWGDQCRGMAGTDE